MKPKPTGKTIAVLLLPLTLFPILLIPYSWCNQKFIVEWFGCGCPILDDFGNTVESRFNANDFTALFWGVISVCTTVIAAFLSNRFIKEKKWLRMIYIIGIFLISLMISMQFCQMMMWN